MQRRRERTETNAHTSYVSYNERIETITKRLLYSNTYQALVASLTIAALVETYWLLSPTHGTGAGQPPPHDTTYLVVETYVTLGLTLDLAARLYLQKCDFFRSPANVLDAAIAAASLLTSLLLALGAQLPSEMFVAELLVAGRVLFRLLRLIAITRSFRRQHAAAGRKLEVVWDEDDVEAPAVGIPGGSSEGWSAERTATMCNGGGAAADVFTGTTGLFEQEPEPVDCLRGSSSERSHEQPGHPP